ncbi:MAG: FHA domain-containing protein [Anaerolineales bacterium]
MSSQIKITLMSGPRDGETLTFTPDFSDGDFELSIGRRENCAISLGYDSQVSRNHARIIYDGSTYWLEDLGSRNGTFIEDNPVHERTPIPVDTLFRVGRTLLRIDPPASDETQITRPVMDDSLF